MGARGGTFDTGGREPPLSRWCVVAIGFSLVGVSFLYVWVLLDGHPLAHGIIGLLPIALSLVLVAVGFWTAFEDDQYPCQTVVPFGVAGGVLAGLLNAWTIGVATLGGEPIPHAMGLILANVSLGAVVGTGAGIYRSRSQARSATTSRLGRAMEMVGDGVVLVDGEQILYANSVFEDLYGYSTRELVGMNVDRLVTEEGRERLCDAVEAVRSGGHWRNEIPGKRRDGSTFPQEVTLSRMDDGTFVGVVRDVTERREREERVTILQRVLRHNLRNELNIISGHAAHIEQDADSEIADHATVIREVVQRLADISDTASDIEQVLDRPATSVRYRLDRLALEAVNAVRASYPDLTIRLEVPPVSVVVDESIESAIEEVLENAAIHATQDDADDVIRVTGERCGDSAVLRIADQGPGMPDQERSVLAEGKETPLNHGSGLGLWLVRWLVSRAGGDVAVSDNEPQGTVVELTFRCASDVD